MLRVGPLGKVMKACLMSRSSRINSRHDAGFTYLWVLFLVALMGIGLVATTEIASTISQRDKEKELLAIGRQFRTAISLYYETQLPGGGRQYPASLEDLLFDKRLPGTKRHLRKLFVDPMTGKPEWGEIRVGGRIVGVHSLSEKMPIKQAGFEGENMNFHGKQKYSDWVFTYPSDLIVQVEAGGAPVMSGAYGAVAK